ncbi:hypothetical protein BR93DRAFT_41637 [Coniochaeta sp. PMI_546]|nr:hypothetical protein BR93DRAFT_41637 [Coniochaeta sp. PMI_546]
MSSTNPQDQQSLDDLLHSDPLLSSAYTFVKSYMSNYDASHDLSHILRVVTLARHIYTRSPPSPPLNLRLILLSALLHDVGDRKYLLPDQDATTLVSTTLISSGCPPDLAATVQTICSGVSYSTEIKDPAATARLVERYPELGVVQDADRLDAIGAVGLGRLFTYGGARTGRSMRETMDHLDEKLVRLEGMMKTEEGRRLARERTERLMVFRGWWVEETGGEGL